MLFNFIWYFSLIAILFDFNYIIQIVLPTIFKILNLEFNMNTLNSPSHLYLFLSSLIGGSIGGYLFNLNKFNKTKNEIKDIIEKSV